MNLNSLKEENLTFLSSEVEELVRLASDDYSTGSEGRCGLERRCGLEGRCVTGSGLERRCGLEGRCVTGSGLERRCGLEGRCVTGSGLEGREYVTRSGLEEGEWVSMKDCKIDWLKVQHTLDGIPEERESEAWFKEAVRLLSPLLHHCHRCLVNLVASQHQTHVLSHLLQWTCQVEGLLTCSELICRGSSCNTDHLTALLSVTAVTERILGDLLWTRHKPVPFLLRDLLRTPDITHVLGPTRVEVLRILVGSVFGLNLRNLAWHGFLTPRQTCPAFPASLIIILADSAHTLQTSPSQDGQQQQQQLATEPLNIFLQGSGISGGVKVCTRPLITFPESVYGGQVFESVKVSRKCYDEIVTTSPIVPKVMIPVWTRIFQLMETHRYGLAMTLLLPAVECSLRCLFSAANQTSRRLLTAQTSTFYTTLDQILHPKVDHGENYIAPHLVQKCDEFPVKLGHQNIDATRTERVGSSHPLSFTARCFTRSRQE
ncbi:hypothetical protein Pmani_032597 [Petrolisthes manimaculis]|uniref:DUF4209 domain-containing protein n=1 Tax=Petrolisthes manimaculis TaxID=1843537 RepID=A0AAE1NT04_9EUCA|nr:hypothetical protein Pmani_032597 [Petrolisthes manimaculis]